MRRFFLDRSLEDGDKGMAGGWIRGDGLAVLDGLNNFDGFHQGVAVLRGQDHGNHPLSWVLWLDFTIQVKERSNQVKDSWENAWLNTLLPLAVGAVGRSRAA